MKKQPTPAITVTFKYEGKEYRAVVHDFSPGTPERYASRPEDYDPGCGPECGEVEMCELAETSLAGDVPEELIDAALNAAVEQVSDQENVHYAKNAMSAYYKFEEEIRKLAESLPEGDPLRQKLEYYLADVQMW